MSVRQAVARAMRSGGVVVPSEFEAIQTQALVSVDVTQLHSGDYLFRGEDVAALGRMRFRNDEERRDFFLGLLQQSRDRILTQIATAMGAFPSAEVASRLYCFSRTVGAGSDTVTPDACFSDASGTMVLSGRVCSASMPASCHESGLLTFLSGLLPLNAFVGLSDTANPYNLVGVQLLDGVMFTRENFQSQSLPRETQISATMLRGLYRAVVCDPSSTLPDCR